MCNKLIKPSFEPTDKLKSTLRAKLSDDKPFLLWQKCYNYVYQIFHAPIPCASCGALPKKGTCWYHHNPDAVVVSQHLQNTIEMKYTSPLMSKSVPLVTNYT